jgi:dihydrofolate synthase/folylpolyglutamate synthase
MKNDEKPFKSSAEVFTWLSRFINLERGQTPKSFRLDRMETIAEFAGHPERCAPAIHIAGSKGKGSVTGMIASVLEAAGYRTARYMSPHVSDYRERISLGNGFFDEAVYCAAAEELRDTAAAVLDFSKRKFRIFDPETAGGEGPTFFELLTLYFFLCARQGNCNAMVIETGLGGRLDSTNIVDPLVSVITLIEKEHTEFLGDTITAIAGEKAGIIKQGRPVILGAQSAEALEVFGKTAAEKQSPLWYFPETASVMNLRVHKGGTDFTLAYDQHNAGRGENPFFSTPLDLSIPMHGAVQAQNAGLAVSALRLAFPAIGEKTISRGLAACRLPARFEKILDDPVVIIDGAHTPESVALCADTLRSLYGDGGILVFGCASGKDSAAMAKILFPHFSRIIITTPGTFKVSSPEKVYEDFCSIQQIQTAENDKVVFIKETGNAIAQALEYGRKERLPVLGIGSFYLAAEIRALTCKDTQWQNKGN